MCLFVSNNKTIFRIAPPPHTRMTIRFVRYLLNFILPSQNVPIDKNSWLCPCTHKVQLYHYCRFCRFNGFYPISFSFFLVAVSSILIRCSTFCILLFMTTLQLLLKHYISVHLVHIFRFRFLSRNEICSAFSEFLCRSVWILNRQINSVTLCAAFCGGWKKNFFFRKSKTRSKKHQHVKANERIKKGRENTRRTHTHTPTKSHTIISKASASLY